jgi:hypothetical protein
MSNFNQANELASELVFGETYDGKALDTPRPERLVFVNGGSTAVVTAHERSQQEWGEVATAIEYLLHDGYLFGCDMNVSWNGRYDANGDPERDSNYTPCGKPVAIFLDGRHLCAKHDPTDYKAKWLATQQGGAGSVDEPPTSVRLSEHV